jgi:hypothetical protein
MCLLGTVLWTFLEHRMTLVIFVIAVQFFHPHNDAANTYVPKRFRKPNGTLECVRKLLTPWVERLELQISRIKMKREGHRSLRHRVLSARVRTASPRTPRKYSHLLSLLTYLAVCMTTEAIHAQTSTGYFDTDSKPIGVDNRCTACISHDTTDFIGDVAPSNRWIKGFGGSKTTNAMTGTLK